MITALILMRLSDLRLRGCRSATSARDLGATVVMDWLGLRHHPCLMTKWVFGDIALGLAVSRSPAGIGGYSAAGATLLASSWWASCNC